jgi:membrane protein
MRRAWALVRSTVEGFIEDEAMTRGAAIACYTLFSLAPLLVVAIAIAGLVFGEDAAHGAVAQQLRALVGREGADAVQSIVRGVQDDPAEWGGRFAALVGVGILLVTASGVFAELQGALNVIWRAEMRAVTVKRLVKARALSVGLVAATGFLLLVSLLASAVLAAVGDYIGRQMPGLGKAVEVANFLLSYAIIAALFAAIYKVLPDRRLRWADVVVGAAVTAFLFMIGKMLISFYIGSSGMAADYGAAGALLVVLVWVYYSAQVFLLGAEFTRAWAGLEAAPPAE